MNVPQAAVWPKIELHVHLEGTIRARTLLAIARRNGLPLPADTVEGLAALYEFRDLAHYLDVWVLTTNCLRAAEDFRQVVVDYAAEAASHGAVYVEGIFSPAERVRTGVSSTPRRSRSPGTAAWPRCRTPARARARARSVPRSTALARTGSGTASVRQRTFPRQRTG